MLNYENFSIPSLKLKLVTSTKYFDCHLQVDKKARFSKLHFAAFVHLKILATE